MVRSQRYLPRTDSGAIAGEKTMDERGDKRQFGSAGEEFVNGRVINLQR